MVAANTGTTKRSGIVTVHTVDQEGEPIVRNLTVIQSGEGSFLDLLVNEAELVSSGDTLKLPTNSSKPITVKSSSDWCVAEVDGCDVVIKAGFNMVEDRTAYVTVMVEDGGEIEVQKVIKVHQKKGVVVFEFNKPVVTLSYDANTSYVQLSSTGEWVLNNQVGVDIPKWLTVSPASGSGDALITLKAKANNFMKDRTTQLSFTNKLSGQSIALEVIQSGNPNGIEGYKYLGMGYDAAGEYASDGSVRAMMVDMDKLEEDGMIAEPISLNTTIERYIYGKTYEEYQSNLSQTANIGGKYTSLLKAFRLSVSNSFSAQTLSSQENEFASFRSITEKRSIKFLNSLTAETMKNYLLDNVKNDISNSSVSPETLFAKYGTHILTGFILGGSLDYSMSADVSSMSNAVEWSVAASGGFKNLAMGISASVEVDSYNRMKKESSNFESSLKARGGESQYTSQNPNVSESTYTSWLSSLENQNKWVMIDYDGTQMIPIWELADDASRQTEIQNAAKTYLEQPIVSKVTTHRYLKLTLTKIGYMSDDAGGTAELKDIKVWANLDGKGEYQMVTPFNIDVDDNASAYPSTGKWGTVNKGPYTIGNTNISMYKTHTVNLRAYIKEDDTTSPDEYAGNLQLIYEPGTGKWSVNGNVVDNGGEFVLSFGSGPSAQMLFTLNWTEN